MFESGVSTDPSVRRNLRGHLRDDRKYAEYPQTDHDTGGGHESQVFETRITLKPPETRRHAILLFILLECVGVLGVFVSH